MGRYGKSKAADVLEKKLDEIGVHQPRRIISRNLYKLNEVLSEIKNANFTEDTKRLLVYAVKDHFIQHIDTLTTVNGEFNSYTKNVITTNCNEMLK